jgi:hypothetical protein
VGPIPTPIWVTEAQGLRSAGPEPAVIPQFSPPSLEQAESTSSSSSRLRYWPDWSSARWPLGWLTFPIELRAYESTFKVPVK